MARRRRPGSRTSVADDLASIVIPAELVVDADGDALAVARISTWLPRAAAYPTDLRAASSGVALVLDRFAWDLHLGDLGHATDTHDGDVFFDAAVSSGTVDIYVVAGLDPRRSSADDLAAAAGAGDLVGARVPAFPVDVLQP